jgi:hypothetical protein
MDLTPVSFFVKNFAEIINFFSLILNLIQPFTIILFHICHRHSGAA